MGAIWIPISLVFPHLLLLAPSLACYFQLPQFLLLQVFFLFCSLLPLLQARKAYIPLYSVLGLINHVGEWQTLLCRPQHLDLTSLNPPHTKITKNKDSKIQIFEVEKMGSLALHCFSFFLLFLHLTSGSGITKMSPPSKSIMKQSRKFDIQESQRPFLYSDATTIRDTPTAFPTMNPTDTTPIVNPSPPTTTSPTTTTPTFTPTPTTPTFTPTTPTTTTPTITPTTPTTTSPTTTTPPSSGGGGSWCVASSSASPTALQVALDYACGYGGADCSAIQSGASCFNPDSVKDHASYAFNSYYQKNPAPTSCSFGGAAQLTNTDPSSGNCHFPSSQSTTSTTTPTTPPTTMTPTTPFMQSPPSPPSPTIMTTPIGGSSVFGEGPTGSPNMAASMDQTSLLLLGSTVALMYLLGTHP